MNGEERRHFSGVGIFEDLLALKAYYQAQGKLVIVEGQEELKDTTALTFKAIEGFCK